MYTMMESMVSVFPSCQWVTCGCEEWHLKRKKRNLKHLLSQCQGVDIHKLEPHMAYDVPVRMSEAKLQKTNNSYTGCATMFQWVQHVICNYLS